MKISCHIVLTQQGVRECRRGVAGSMEKRKREKSERRSVSSLFLPSSTQSFPSLFVLPVCVCLCEHTGTLESFTDYLTHVMSF